MSKESISYQSELLPSAEQTAKGKIKKSRDSKGEKNEPFFHYFGLFDEDVDQAGESLDASTGKRYDNSTMRDETHFQTTETGYEVTIGEDDSTDVLGSIPEEEDDAAIYLREHEQMPDDNEHEHLSGAA